MTQRFRYLGWAAVYTVGSIAACHPFLKSNPFGVGADWGDARLIAWTLAWHARWPLTGAWPLDAPLFAPEASALAYTEPMLGLGLAVFPITAAFGPFVSFDLLRVAIPVANGLAMAYLARHYLRDDTSAFVSGSAIAFAYQQTATMYMGLLHLGPVVSFCITAVLLDKWWHAGRTRHLATAVAVSCAGALVSWYSAVVGLIVIGCQLTWLAIIERLSWRMTVSRRHSPDRAGRWRLADDVLRDLHPVGASGKRREP